MFRKLIKWSKNLLKYAKSGGVVYVNVTPIQYGNILKDKNIVIIGGSSGFGYAMAKKFLSEGANVIITGRNNEKLKEAEKELESTGNIHSLCWDISNNEELSSKFSQAVKILGSIDVFVNNAGIWKPLPYFKQQYLILIVSLIQIYVVFIF